MATIKEMAEVEFPTIPIGDYDALDALKYLGIEMNSPQEYNYVREEQQNLFIKGANAVLSEIENCLPKTPSFNPNEVIDIITSKIKEFKG